MLAAQVSNARPGRGHSRPARSSPNNTRPAARRRRPGPRTASLRLLSKWPTFPTPGRRRHDPRPFLSRLSRPEGLRCGARRSSKKCLFLFFSSRLRDRREPQGECLSLVLRTDCASALGTVSKFLKNYFNQVRQLPSCGREGSAAWGGERNLGSVLGLRPGEGLGPPAPRLAPHPREPGLGGRRRAAQASAARGLGPSAPQRRACPCAPAAARSPAPAFGFPSLSQPRLQLHQ